MDTCSQGIKYKLGASWLALLPFLVSLCSAEDFKIDSIGVRFGFSANRRGQQFVEDELFSDWNVPWKWEYHQWRIEAKLDFSVGGLSSHSDNAFIGQAGPSFLLRHENWRPSIELGSNATYISRDTFGARDLGSVIQFTSHAAFNWDFTSHIRLGYRFHHMSNGGIGLHNPGLNVHLLSVSYLF